MVLIYILAYINLNFFEIVCLEKTDFQNSTISIYGYCFDNSTIDILPVKGKVLIKSSTPIYFNSNTSGMLDLKIPTSATTIIFESPGYKKEVIPIHVIAPYTDDNKFVIKVPMSKADSIPTFQRNILSLRFFVKDDIEVRYKFSLKKEPQKFTFFTYLPKHMPKHIGIDFDNIGDYILTATLNNDELLFTEEFTIKEGINFKTLVVDSKKLNAEKIEKISGIEKKDKLRILFNQSDYVLNDSSKTNLDALSTLLLNNARQRVKIVGHTDNAGKENLNVTLSEYRARVVAQYLLKKGVPQSQIELDWKGSSLPVSSNDSEEQRKLNRRVEIQLFD